MNEENVEEREAFILAIESCFLFLATDARSTLRHWRLLLLTLELLALKH